MKPHSVHVIKLVDGAVPAAAPSVTAQVPSSATVDQMLTLTADATGSGVPALAYHWDFGDGAKADGEKAVHAYTRTADYTVRADGWSLMALLTTGRSRLRLAALGPRQRRQP